MTRVLTRAIRPVLLAGLCVGGLAAVAPAQEEMVQLIVTTEGLREATQSADLFLADPTVMLIMLPPVDDLMPPDETQESAAALAAGGQPSGGLAALGLGVESLFEVSAKQKSFVLGPYYRAGQRLWLKARLPIIFEREMTYFDAHPTASGLGDASLQVDYAWPLAMTGSKLRTRLDVKLPTGDSEKMDGNYLVPLGTGSWDFVLGAQFSRRLPRAGYLANLAYRKNTPNALTVQQVNAGAVVSTTDYDVTNASSLAFSAFGWHSLTPRLAAHLGASLLVVGDGKTEFSTTPTGGTTASGSYENGQKMTILDLYPGITYKLGPINPFLGVRIPVVSEYDVERDRENRDLAVILQFTYQPGRMRHERSE